MLYVGAQPDKIIFSGVGKSNEELVMAMQNEIKSINIESISELNRINLLSKNGNKPNISLRIILKCLDTHPYLETDQRKISLVSVLMK